jgi:hypothetical protein
MLSTPFRGKRQALAGTEKEHPTLAYRLKKHDII